jgi:hypothetical protein
MARIRLDPTRDHGAVQPRQADTRHGGGFVSEIDPNDAEQKKYVDWAHIRFEPPAGHYFSSGLNRISLDALKALTERYYEIEIWRELASRKSVGGKRLTQEIVASFPELTRRDLKIHNVFCVAKRNAAAPDITPDR